MTTELIPIVNPQVAMVFAGAVAALFTALGMAWTGDKTPTFVKVALPVIAFFVVYGALHISGYSDTKYCDIQLALNHYNASELLLMYKEDSLDCSITEKGLNKLYDEYERENILDQLKP